MKKDYEMTKEYSALASTFLKKYFYSNGRIDLTILFPCMRDDYSWGDHRPPVLDSRIAAKNNTEYHGLERHAKQYHVTAQYEESYHFWIMAADWRHQDMIANNFYDDAHKNAISFAIKQALYNKALADWQKVPFEKPTDGAPKPEKFGLNKKMQKNLEIKWEEELEVIISNLKNKHKIDT